MNSLPKLLLPVCGLFLIFSLVDCKPKPLTSHVSRIEEALGTEKERDNEQEDGILEAMQQEIALTRDPFTGEVPTERLLTARSLQRRRLTTQRPNTAVPGISWVERGPANVGGRTRALIYDANDAVNGYKKVWAGSVGGGLWSCNDITAATPVWSRANDFFGNIAINTIAQDPTNPQNMYFGTGEGYHNGDAIRGLGIWKSSNGGTTWAQLASTNNSNFYFVEKVLVSPTGTVFAATHNAGIQRSVDGGVTFTTVLGAGTNGGLVNQSADLEVGADGKIYAVLGLQGTSDGVYRSTDDGLTWGKIYTPASTDEQRMEMGISALNPDLMYVLVQDRVSLGIKKILKTINATAAIPANVTWASLALPAWCDQGAASTDFTRGQAWYDLTCKVDPTNDNIVYLGGVDIMKSTDGATFTQLTQWASGCGSMANVHADIHEIAIRPGVAAELLVGCDGGVYRSINSGIAFTQRNNGYNVTQYYSCAIHPTLPNYFLAGAQDNGTQKFTTAGVNTTSTASGGDGAFTHIDQQNGNLQITSFTGNNFTVSSNGGTSFQSFGFPGGSFINPTDFDDNEKILYGFYTGGQYIRWKNPGPSGVASAVTIPAFSGGTITNVTVSPLTLNRVYFGLSSGSVVRVDNANGAVTPVGTVIKTGAGSVSGIAVDVSNEDHMLVTYSNYGVTSVFESLNANQASPTWTDVEGNLPDMPVRWVMFDPRNSDWAIIATELGVWSTDNLNGAGTDWQPTNTNFANVRVDMLQYRSSDRTLAAATHGRGLFTTTIPASTTPNIFFASAVTSKTESTTASSSCVAYTDYSIDMQIENAPAGDAIVTLDVAPGNTATEGQDFIYTTNGNFTTPLHAITFANGSTSSHTVNIRVYNDASVEPDESFVLEYTLSGSTNAVKGGGPQTYSIEIKSDDVAPNPTISSTVYQVGSAVYYLGDATEDQPFDSKVQKLKTQFVYKASELTAAGITAGNLTAVAFNLAKNSTRPYTNLQVKMGLTTRQYLSDAAPLSVTTSTVKTLASFTSANGWNTLPLDVPFAWDGTSSVAVEICYDNGIADPTQQEDLTIGYDDGGTSSDISMVWQLLDCGTNFGASYNVNNFGVKPEIRFTRTAAGTSIDSTLNHSKTENLGPNADVYFYAPSGEILAHIKNNSGFDYGCTQVIVDRAGHASTAFWNNNTPNYLMDKTIHVIPTNNNASGNYDITLYYTQAEVDGWQTATGQPFSSINLVKVQSQITDVTPANPTGGGAVEIVVPTKGSFGTHSTLTYTFNTGFSGFGAGITGAALPVTLTDFNGILKNGNAVLSWVTQQEQHNLGFYVQRSYTGTDFKDVGFVKGAGTSSNALTYGFTDKSIAQENNYYRLRQVDEDQRFTFSKVINLRNPLIGNSFRILSNPFHDYIDMQLNNATPPGNFSVRLLTVSGQVMFRQQFNDYKQSRLRLDLGHTALVNGVYLLEVTSKTGKAVEKLIRQ